MGKGNMFVGSAAGKVGNLVLYARKGEQITRAYQSQVTNPKTNSQMLQRAKFANAVKFYQKAVQHFFKFAYQDKKSNETVFNAFMRHNVGVSCALRKDEVGDAYFPALGRWVLSSGSLASAFVPRFDNGNAIFGNTGISSSNATVADVSNVLIGQGFNAGDIVTLVMISSLVNSVDFDLTNYYDSGNLTQPQWDVRQFIISASDTTAIASLPRLGSAQGDLSVIDGGLQFAFTHADYSNAAACIITRKGDSITYASNSELVPNAVTLAMIQQSQTTAWINEVLVSWGANGDAILHGSIASGQTTTSGSGTSGTGTSGGSTSGGSSTTSAISTINGGADAVSITTRGDTAITVVGTALSSTQPTVGASGATITGFTLNTDKTEAKFTVNVPTNTDSLSTSVSYMGRTVANISISSGDDDAEG